MRSYEIGDDAKSATLNMFVSKAWKARVSTYAKRRKITLSEAVRRLVEDSLERAEPRAPAPAKPRPPASGA
jgi:macrodomain Ter protein organizer (MatP/YcbG family)